MGSEVGQLKVLEIHHFVSRGRLEEFFLTVEAMDHQEQINDELFQKVDNTELEDVFASFLEDSGNGHLLDASVVLDVIAEFVDVFNYL